MRGAVEQPVWDWTAPARRVLSTFLFLGAIVLIVRTWSVEQAPGSLPPLVVDPNEVPEQVLLALPRLGPARAGAIVEARRRSPLRSLEDLDGKVPGIGPVTARDLAPYLRFPTGPDPRGTPAP